MKLNRGRRRRRDLKKSVGNGEARLSELPNDVLLNILETQSTEAATNVEDRLSELPNDLLLNILERVGTLDAVRTCILSKKMHKLPTMLSQIVIDLSPRDLIQMDGVVAHVADKILSTRSPQITVRKLKLKFFLVPSRCLSIGKSVGLAMATQKFDAAEFEIMTLRDNGCCTDAHRLVFAQQFNDFVGDCPDAFSGLTRLDLRNMRFGESDIPNILSTCKQLESLSLFECDGGVCSVLHVEHARLVEFVITFGEFKTVVLDRLPRLQRMTYNIWPCGENPLVLGFVPQLWKLSLTKANLSSGKILNLSKLLDNAPTVSDLYLDFLSEKIWVQPECPKVLAPVLAKLRFLNLDHLPEECDITWTLFLLEAAPYLEELCITVWDHKCRMESQKSISEKSDVKWEPSVPHFKHKKLVRLIIYGFQSDDNFIGYVRRVIQAAVNIREVSLHDRKVCQWCFEKFPHLEVRPSSYPRTSEELDLLREKMTAASATASPFIHFRS
uniref:F-box domain-containing protein n=1 Tax=Hordeum vulgare subsp. vulgare TaxID=112509 RepID=A0A8I6YFC9_HORVV